MSKKISIASKAAVLTEDALKLVAARFRVLGEPLRLRLLNSLREGEKTVSDLVAIAETSQANVSKHLGIMVDAGLIGRRREGPFSYYFILDPIVFDLCDLVCERLREELESKAASLRPSA